MTTSLLEVRDLCVTFDTSRGPVRAVRAVAFSLAPAEVMGLVGESGSGKSVSCRALMRLLPPRGVRMSGVALFQGRDILALPEEELRDLRGTELAMIFQNPSSHLNPVMPVGDQIAEPVLVHEGASRRQARARAAELLRQVGIPDPDSQLDRYPHQFSGGMRQRVMIAAALACRPKLLIADEPTTALDVTVQAQILRLLLELRDRSGLAIVLISHNLGVIAQTCDSVSVMYGGRVVERGSKRDVLSRPHHPYTEALIRSQPESAPLGAPLPTIEGQPPAPSELPTGCAFHPRCPYAQPVCVEEAPPLEETQDGRRSACWRWPELAARSGVTP
ncbi:MAG TPA: ABC transporter ATP-binding protein [Alphaproteobacteria bacterium]|nr:ABC transporter ATP-binding protein [Alphaproteobacteria bacterium]